VTGLSLVEMSVKGKTVSVPSVEVDGLTIVAAGRWSRIASVKDEAWILGDVVPRPDDIVEKIRKSGLRADMFTFTGKLSDATPRFDYPHVWENVAAIPITEYRMWWNDHLPQVTRKNVRRAAKRGVSIREIAFDDEFVKAVVTINNETPVRQGRPFWHYGKSFDVVKQEYSTFPDRSSYIGAFHEAQLVGFIKMVYIGDRAGILQLLCMNKHHDKRPANALIARAVQICCEKKLKYLLYGQYVYGNNTDSPLTEFKRRNGFEKKLFPRYYIPLSLKGRILIGLGLHTSMKRVIPREMYRALSGLRSKWYKSIKFSYWQKRYKSGNSNRAVKQI